MVLFSDEMPFPFGFVISEPENVPSQLRFPCCHTGLGLEFEHWPLRSDGTMSLSPNGETLSHRWWQQADAREPLAGAPESAPGGFHIHGAPCADGLPSPVWALVHAVLGVFTPAVGTGQHRLRWRQAHFWTSHHSLQKGDHWWRGLVRNQPAGFPR